MTDDAKVAVMVPLHRVFEIIEHDAAGWEKQNDTVIANAVHALIPSLSAAFASPAPASEEVGELVKQFRTACLSDEGAPFHYYLEGYESTVNKVCDLALSRSARPAQGAALGYCIVNSAGKMHWSEGCISESTDHLDDEIECLQEDEPDGGWHIVPFFAAPAKDAP